LGLDVAVPLISLSETPPVEIRAAWSVYIGDDDPRHVPAAVGAMGQYLRHVCVCGPFGVEFWYQFSHDGETWYFGQKTG
jgi:hypothetical protein